MVNVENIACVNCVDYQVDNETINRVVEHTNNTWQKDRSKETKQKDTELGKKAEWSVTKYIQENIGNLTLISYDDFRTNNFNKHAPFDCLIYKKELAPTIPKITKMINEEITLSRQGAISYELKHYCMQQKVYVCEVKATRITSRLRNADSSPNLSKILNDDFLAYPKITRIDSQNKIQSISDYVVFANKVSNKNRTQEEILHDELKNMSHIYIRVYMDEITNMAYIVSLISAKTFIANLSIKHMSQPNKSESALYLATKLKNGVPIKDLSLLGR